MSHAKVAPSVAALRKEIVRLNNSNMHLAARIAELESRLGTVAPVVIAQFEKRPIHIIVWMAEPMALADDVVGEIPSAPPPRLDKGKENVHAAGRLRRLGLGHREVFTIERALIREAWKLIDRSVSRSLGVSTRMRYISFVTPLGIESLRERAPKFCKWVETEAFPKAIEQLGKRGV